MTKQQQQQRRRLHPSLWKESHFWVANINALVGLVIANTHWIPIAQTQFALGLLLIVDRIIYQAAAEWSPPRVPWTAEERRARGLPPAPPSPADLAAELAAARAEIAALRARLEPGATPPK